MSSLVQRLGTFSSPNDAVLSHEDGTPELAATVFRGQQTKVVNDWKSSSWLSSLCQANCLCCFCCCRLVPPFPVLFQLLPMLMGLLRVCHRFPHQQSRG